MDWRNELLNADLLRPYGAGSRATFTHGLRRGLYYYARFAALANLLTAES